ncbi:protein kinase [Proteinivorax hydrogeniformans]|uniref:Protein kinase n=1 Tax=Proteinivorax hydrogeniformans TaxID=1826727 RepID=A0AAU8HV46_9FIRM
MKGKLGDYIINTNPIGRGRYASVFRGFDKFHKKPVAIKVTPNLKRAYREVKVLKHIGYSKYFPTLYDFFIQESKGYIIMEYIDGECLGGEFYSYGKRYEQKIALEIIINLLKGLHRIHDRGYFHRDTKPKNIMIIGDNPEKIKIIDFNVAGVIKGTNSIQKDLRYSAALFLYLTNGPMHEKNNKAEFIIELDNLNFKNNDLKTAILNAYNKNPNHRYNSAMEFVDALIPFW